eukprot:TRINITY_DN14104_c0_g1_i1.p1 TRINITY_DN14104_c0_g1~~TRINITY_DN14104_c0_g1_i1.p1  ORF type:complete len:302 (-),score=81.08 TRINITY_DN14104_c0_g1_i1:208-1113(-)
MVLCEIIVGLLVFFVLVVVLADKLSRKPFDFKGKVVVLTGASSGIGEYLAYELASKSTKLLLVARREDLLRVVAQRCKDFGAQDVKIHVADVSEKKDNQGIIEAAQQHYGRIDALILNAGRGSLKRFEEVTEDDLNEYKDIMDVNYWGCVYATYYALPYLKQSKGIIVVISSLAGKIGPPTRTGYAPTKFALHGFFNSLRTEVGSDVGITLICPGFVLSQIHDRALGAREKGVTREVGQFMPTEVCARIVVQSAEAGKREEVMTPIGKLGVFLLPFIPSLLDFVAIRKSKAAVKLQPTASS